MRQQLRTTGTLNTPYKKDYFLNDNFQFDSNKRINNNISKDTYTVVSLWTKFFNSQQLQFDYLKDARGLHVVELL